MREMKPSLFLWAAAMGIVNSGHTAQATKQKITTITTRELSEVLPEICSEDMCGNITMCDCLDEGGDPSMCTSEIESACTSGVLHACVPENELSNVEALLCGHGLIDESTSNNTMSNATTVITAETETHDVISTEVSETSIITSEPTVAASEATNPSTTSTQESQQTSTTTTESTTAVSIEAPSDSTSIEGSNILSILAQSLTKTTVPPETSSTAIQVTDDDWKANHDDDWEGWGIDKTAPLAEVENSENGNITDLVTAEIETFDPSARPSLQPTTIEPSASPSRKPTGIPSSTPSFFPTTQPTAQPSSVPSESLMPSVIPSSKPSSFPTLSPSNFPSNKPSSYPSASGQPSFRPSSEPSSQPSLVPSGSPSEPPSSQPSSQPSNQPSSEPSDMPSTSAFPTSSPSSQPSIHPTTSPSSSPSVEPSSSPSESPSSVPSAFPSVDPTETPSASPSSLPTLQPSVHPTAFPSSSPSIEPTAQPSSSPSSMPSASPSHAPSSVPTVSSEPSSNPSFEPSGEPTSVKYMLYHDALKDGNYVDEYKNGFIGVTTALSVIVFGGVLLIGLYVFKRRNTPHRASTSYEEDSVDEHSSFDEDQNPTTTHSTKFTSLFGRKKSGTVEHDPYAQISSYGRNRSGRGQLSIASSQSYQYSLEDGIAPTPRSTHATSQRSAARSAYSYSFGEGSSVSSQRQMTVESGSEDSAIKDQILQSEAKRARRTVYAPAGKLGIIVDTSTEGPVVHGIKDGSPLVGNVFIGDLIVAVDDEDTSDWSAHYLTKLVARKSGSVRKLTLCSPGVLL